MNQDKYFPFKLNKQQTDVFNSLTGFISDFGNNAFILKGYAGTGKSTLMSGLIKYLTEKKIDFVLLASTGRAAKILSDKTGVRASTVHSQIYVFNGLSDDIYEMYKDKEKLDVDDKGQISLQFSLATKMDAKKVVYIVDESSMIADRKSNNDSFADYGSGRLLNDLLTYDKEGKYVFIGDPNQLPPVNEKKSPALNAEYLQQQHQLNSLEYELNQIIRQKEESGIVKMSMNIRKQFNENLNINWPKLKAYGFNDVSLHAPSELINNYIDLVGEKGYDYCTLIAPSNRLCTSLSNLVRKSLFDRPGLLVKDELLLVTQNNMPTGFVNGDLVMVLDIGDVEIRCGLNFRLVEVIELSTQVKKKTLLIEEVISSNVTNINSKQHKDLMIDFTIRMRNKGINQNDKAYKDAMRNDPYLNALKVVYGYALTCHKSQGGEWEEVFLYLDKSMYVLGKPAIYQWWYTAVTRAKSTLRLGVVHDWVVN